jgi:hypothetical protein
MICLCATFAAITYYTDLDPCAFLIPKALTPEEQDQQQQGQQMTDGKEARQSDKISGKSSGLAEAMPQSSHLGENDNDSFPTIVQRNTSFCLEEISESFQSWGDESVSDRNIYRDIHHDVGEMMETLYQ